jgi:hypothetical protein
MVVVIVAIVRAVNTASPIVAAVVVAVLVVTVLVAPHARKYINI